MHPGVGYRDGRFPFPASSPSLSQLPSPALLALLQVTSGRAELVLGDLHYTPYHLKLMDLSVPYHSECLTFLTPEATTDNSWQTLILPFKSASAPAPALAPPRAATTRSPPQSPTPQPLGSRSAPTGLLGPPAQLLSQQRVSSRLP